MIYFVLELGLKSALHATSALYSEDIEALSSLTAAEVTRLFQTSKTGIGLAEVTLQPGTTILDMSLQAGCFNSKSKFHKTLKWRFVINLLSFMFGQAMHCG